MTILVVLLFLLVPSDSIASKSIQAVLDKQVSAWNQGDLAAFVTTYSDDCIFVGKPILIGRSQLLTRYQKRYPTPEAMGHLTFSHLGIHLLDKNSATVTADWHLDRSPAAGGNVGGYFSLVFHRVRGNWKIALDHTTLVP